MALLKQTTREIIMSLPENTILDKVRNMRLTNMRNGVDVRNLTLKISQLDAIELYNELVASGSKLITLSNDTGRTKPELIAMSKFCGNLIKVMR